MTYGVAAYGESAFGEPAPILALVLSGNGSLSGVADLTAVSGSVALSGAGSLGLTTSTYHWTVMQDSPDAYYRMQESSGTTMVDWSGNGRNGTYTASPILATTGLLANDPSTAVDFNGTSQYGSVADAAWMDVTKATFEAWIKPDNVTSYRTVMNRDAGSGTSSQRSFDFRISSSSKVELVFWTTSTGPHTVTGATTLSVGTTYHVAATFDGTTATVYLNGAVDAVGSYNGDLRVSNAPLSIGVQYQGGTRIQYFDGVIDEAAHYDKALSAARIKAHYEAGKQQYTLPLSGEGSLTFGSDGYAVQVLNDGPIAYYRQGEPSGTTMVDASGNARNGTYAGSPTFGVVGPAGTLDTAVTYNGTSQYATVAGAAWIPDYNSGSWSVELWMKYTSTAFAAVIANRVNAGTNTQVTCILTIGRTAGYVGVETWDWQTASSRAIADQANNDGNWHHVVATYDSVTAALSLYIDGVLNDVRTQAATGSTGTRSLTIAANTGGSQQWFPGSLDEVAFYNKALSPARVLAHYTLGTPTVATTLALGGSGALSLSSSSYTGTMGLSGSGTLTTDGIPSVSSAVSLAGDGSLSLAAEIGASGALALAGEGFLSSPFLGSAGLTGAGALTLDGGPGILGSLSLGGSGSLGLGSAIPGLARTRNFAGSGTLTLAGTTDIDPGLQTYGLGVLSMDTSAALENPLPVPQGNRWILWTPDDPSRLPYYLDINPNKMGSPTFPKSFSHARSVRQPKDTISIAGMARTRSFMKPSGPVSWEFGGVILTRDQHDELLDWSKYTGPVNVTDHLGRTFEVMMEQFDPTERRPTQARPWRFDYVMRVLLLRQVEVTL